MWVRQGSLAGRRRGMTAKVCWLIAALAALVVGPGVAQPAWAGDRPADTPAWLEPRVLSVVDLVGLVPEEHLAGSILAFTCGGGIVQYAAGQRVGDTVAISVTVSPRAQHDVHP